MGKKRRYINRARKFAKKAFAFLDKLDGSAADGAIEEYDAFVDTVVVADNEDQTITVTGRVLGNVEGLADDKVQYSRDGGANWTDGPQISDDSSVGSDRFTYTISNIGQLPGTPFSVGTNDIMVRAKGVTDAQRDKAASFTVRENKIETDEGAFADDTLGNITLTTADIFKAGKIEAGSVTEVSDGSNGFKITAALEDGTVLDVSATVADINKAAAAALAATESVLDNPLAEAATVILTITPKTAAVGQALLNASATEVRISVTV